MILSELTVLALEKAQAVLAQRCSPYRPDGRA